MTKKYGILAYPAKHSLSPAMHNAAFSELGIDAEYRIFEIAPERLAEFMEEVKHEPIYGLSVSLPHKEAVMLYMNEIDEDAKRIGAVNVVVNKGGFLYGYNTDFLGSNRALTEAVGALKGKRVVIIGAGGAARAVVYGVMREGADVYIMNRTKEKAQTIAVEFAEMFESEIHSGGLDELFSGDLLINTTSIWTNKDGNELPGFCKNEYVKGFELIMDISYGSKDILDAKDPFMTPLLEVAEEMAVKYIKADKMLLYQALEQFKLWTGKEAPAEVMREVLESIR